MTTIYSARWVVPVSSQPIEQGAIAVDGDRIVAVGEQRVLSSKYQNATTFDFGEALIVPGLVNTHSHLELTGMRGFLDPAETDFFVWLKKLTLARLERLTPDDLFVSAAWGACEAARAGVTAVGDASDSASLSMKALCEVGLRGIVFQESFGPDPRLTVENFAILKSNVEKLKTLETDLVKCGVSPHAPYSVCPPQLEMISRFAIEHELPVMMHAAESPAEVQLLREGKGKFAVGLSNRGIDWQAPGISTIQYLKRQGLLDTKPLLAHCIYVDDADLDAIKSADARIAHCPKSNAKLNHGVAPFAKFLGQGIKVGLGSDSVASNNTCDLIEEARFALLLSRTRATGNDFSLSAENVMETATRGGAMALGLDEQIGELRVGLAADFAVVSLQGVHQIPSYDPATTIISASSGRDVVLTVVAGKEVYAEGRVTNADEDRLRARMREIQRKLSK